MSAEPPRPPALTFAQAAAELAVDPSAISRLVVGGHLVAYVPPGRSLGDGKRGPKGCRILRADWDAYIASRRMVGMGATVEPVASPVAPRNNHAPVTGTDGIDRLRETSAARRARLAAPVTGTDGIKRIKMAGTGRQHKPSSLPTDPPPVTGTDGVERLKLPKNPRPLPARS